MTLWHIAALGAVAMVAGIVLFFTWARGIVRAVLAFTIFGAGAGAMITALGRLVLRSFSSD